MDRSVNIKTELNIIDQIKILKQMKTILNFKLQKCIFVLLVNIYAFKQNQKKEKKRKEKVGYYKKFLNLGVGSLCSPNSLEWPLIVNLVAVRALNSVFQKWGISAQPHQWNISGEPCSGAAIDSTNFDDPNQNPFIKCDCSFNYSSTCHITQLYVSLLYSYAIFS